MDPMKPAEIMAIANQAKPIDAQQVFSIVESSVKKKTASIESKLDIIMLQLEELSKTIKNKK